MTPEQIAALRAAAEKVHSKAHYAWDSIYPLNFYTPATVLELLDHIAKLEAERDAALEKAAASFESFFRYKDMVDVAYVVEYIRALKSTPLTDEQRHEAVSQILKGE